MKRTLIHLYVITEQFELGTPDVYLAGTVPELVKKVKERVANTVWDNHFPNLFGLEEEEIFDALQKWLNEMSENDDDCSIWIEKQPVWITPKSQTFHFTPSPEEKQAGHKGLCIITADDERMARAMLKAVNFPYNHIWYQFTRIERHQPRIEHMEYQLAK